MRVLIIKLTSMGDLMHAFPAITDAVDRVPNITFDWVVDEGFAEVPQWHPAVDQVITTAHRRWKKNFSSAWKNSEFSAFHQRLNRDDYDVIIDLQSNLKSALVSWLRKGVVHSYDKNTCREKPAYWAYQKQYNIPLKQHAIERQREIFSRIFSYERPSTVPNYGVDLSAYPLPDFSASSSAELPELLPEHYVVCVHNASWPTKLWPLDYWTQLIQKISDKGYTAVLPCGSQEEYERAQAIAKAHVNAIALPKMALNNMAAILSHAKAAVCSDTGLAHMAAVAATPAITLYAVTDTLLIGTVGQGQQHIVADNQQTNAAMSDISVEAVWEQLQPLL